MRINKKEGTDIEFRAPRSFVSMTRLGESLFVHGSVFGRIERSIIFLCYLLVLLCILLSACIVSFYSLSGASFLWRGKDEALLSRGCTRMNESMLFIYEEVFTIGANRAYGCGMQQRRKRRFRV